MEQSLALKYRPKTLGEVIGQDSAIHTIAGLIKSKKFNRGILLCGQTGVGKTSLARIIARAVNCEALDLKTFNPCGKCSYCRNKESLPDVSELNFSESRGIDSVRELLESCEYAPQSNYKIFILDEMHNMTSQAANAFLKVLEEPPPHVLFILLTTEPQKILPTIKNRCLLINLPSIEDEILHPYLTDVAQKEEVQLPDYAYKYILKLSKGSVRQALSCLETLIFNVRETSDLDLSQHNKLAVLLGSAELGLDNYADFLLQGVYSGRYSRALAALKGFSRVPSFNFKVFFDYVFEYHMQTFNLFVDPKKSNPILFDSYYADWYQSLMSAVKSQVKGRGVLRLTMESAAEITDILYEMSFKLKEYDADMHKIVTANTLKMIRAVYSYDSLAYTKKSLFHYINAKELCHD